MLKLNNIVKKYPNDSRNILNHINLEAKRGELIAIVGKSGSGKTTLLSIISGLEKTTEGTITFDNFDLTSLSNDQYANFRNEHIGIVFQEFNLIDDLNVLDNIMLPLNLSSSDYNQNKKQAMQLLKKFRMEHIYKRLAKNLSGGEKAKVSIARAMIQNPDIILCDEPTGSLDNENASIVFQTLKQISKDKLVIVVTHDDALIEDYSTRLIRIHDGIIQNDQSRIIKEHQDSTFFYRTKKKKENTKIITKMLTSNLFHKNSKTTLSIFSLSFSFLLMLLSTMLLFGFKYNSLQSIKEISSEYVYVGHRLDNTEITNEDLAYLMARNTIEEAFIQKILSAEATTETVTYGTTFETISTNLDKFKYRKQLVGSYPNTPNQVIVSYDFAKSLVGSNLSDQEMLNALESKQLEVAFSSESKLLVDVVGFVQIQTKENYLAIFYPNNLFDTWLESQNVESMRFEAKQLVIILESTKQIQKQVDAIYDDREIILNKSTFEIEEYIQSEYRFLTSVLVSTTIISIGLGVATIYMQMKNSIKNHTKKVSILIALGSQKETIRHLFLYESLLIGALSFVIAMILASMFGVFIDLALSSQFVMILSNYQNIIIDPIRVLASGWFIYPLFFVVMMSLIYVGCSYLLQTSNFYSISENLKKD